MDCKLIVVFLGLVAAVSCYSYHYNPCHPNPCPPQARCRKTGNGFDDYKCLCPPGKKYDPLTFECAGPCSSHPCGSAECVGHGSSYKCKCPSGKYFDKQHQYCKGPCDDFPCGWVKCKPTGPTSHKCVCPIGKKFDITHQNCKPIPKPKRHNFRGSKVLNGRRKEKQRLRRLMGEIAPNGVWKKCYTASENGYRAAAFHKKCDNKGPTVSIFRVGNKIFGGYTPVSWNSKKYMYRKTSKAMLFSLWKNFRAYSTRYPQHAMYTNGGAGPSFGGNDLLTQDQCNRRDSKSQINYTFPTKYKDRFPTSPLTGLRNNYFKINEYEVYVLVKK